MEIKLSHLLLSPDVFNKNETEQIRDLILRENRLDELIEIFLKDNIRLTQKAAIVLCEIAVQKPGLLDPYLILLLNNLYKEPEPTNAIKRNTLRVLQLVKLPIQCHDMAVDKCFEYLENRKEAIAIQVFAMTILSNIANSYPELKKELRILIEDRMEQASAGFRSRGKKILKKLN